ncbi:MAG: hypothetical protein JJU31_16150 [Wenzhouxiangella sp.]|nr:hypothetical protein [Wenzhouxiangella sp.]TVR96473.1 MAG: hypothetical protein EA418_05375 [Wenzhouxiangellaceae bacterium]
MIPNDLLNGFTFGLSLTIVSWMVGIIGGAMLLKTIYFERLSNLNFISSKSLNKAIGIGQFKWVVKNSFFRYLNQSIKVGGKTTGLASVRSEMTVAEINHLIGFVFVAAAALYQSFNIGIAFGLSMMIPNVFLNLYPSLLQQENKRRIDRLLNRRPRQSV